MSGLTKWRQGNDFTGKLWPNGEFGLGFQKRVKMQHKVRRVESRFDNPQGQLERDFAVRMALAQRWCDETGRDAPTLGLSPHANSHKRAKRGLKGITSLGRKMVRNGAYLLQQKYGKQHLSFLTVTLPAVSVEESLQISACWSEIVRKYLQSLRRLLQGRSLPGEIVGCTEIQESRLERDGVLGLHLHLIFVGRKQGKSWVVSCQEVRELWRRELERVVGRSLDCSSTENIERVKVDAEQYLGKYMSKGVSSMNTLISLGLGDFLPSTWWSMSMSLKKVVKSGIEHLTGEKASLFVRLVEMAADAFLYAKPVEVTLTDGQTLKVGYFGKVKREFIQMMYG